MEYIYIITSPENEHFNKYKIGRTSNPEKKDLLRRYHTSLPEVKILEFISVYNSKIVEESIHKLLDKFRIKNSEWFQGDLFLFQQTTYAECLKSTSKNLESQSEIVDKLFEWFQKYYDPYQTFEILDVNESKMKINIGSERFLCPISHLVHTEHRYHSLKLNFNGDLFFHCSVCEKKKNLGNIGYKPVFYQTESKFEPSQTIMDVAKKLKQFDKMTQIIGYMHVKTNQIYDVEDNVVYHKDTILFQLDDDLEKRQQWLDFQKKHELYMFECIRAKEKIELICLTGECFSFNECVKFEFKDNKLFCLDCGHVKEFDSDHLLERVEKFMKKYSTFNRKQDNYYIFNACECPIHKENHELIVEITKGNCVELRCKAMNKIMNFAYPKIGKLDAS